MKLNWYYRTLLSYTPIFFVIVSSLIFVFFATLSSSSRNEYRETNKAILQQVVQITDANLQLIERNLSKKMFTGGLFQSFFTDTPKKVYEYYLIQKDLLELSSTFPFSNSIYLYNAKTGEFLTTSGKYNERTFGDSAFFNIANLEPGLQGWTNPREFRESDQHHPEQVVSIFKYFPYPSDKQGAVVLNVSVKSILDELGRLNPQNSPIVLLDPSNQPFESDSSSKGKSIFVQSDYTGWQYYSESVHEGKFTLLSLFSNIWMIFGLAVIVLAIVWFTVVTHSNYKPIQTIAGKINPYIARRSEGLGIKASGNELHLIEGAIDHLLEKTVDYDHLHSERQHQRLRSFYYDVLTGSRTVNDEEWARQLDGFGLPYSYDRLGVIVFEIDHYVRFKEQYSSSDQYLLKYIVENAFRELVEQRKLCNWQVWVQPHQLAAVVHCAAGIGQEQLQHICEEYRDWITTHLELTLSSGIGELAESISRIEKSYRSAKLHVSHKAAFGTNAVIYPAMVKKPDGMKRFNWYQAMQETLHFFKLNDPQWTAGLDGMLEGMRHSLLTGTDLSDFFHQLAHLLDRDMSEQSAELQQRWRELYREELLQLALTIETIDELARQLPPVLSRLYEELTQDRSSRSNHSLAMQMKAYIDQHYDDPNLSLNQVSDLFGVSPKNVSSIFKEELDIKFIDYLLKVRFDHAKRLLLETEEPIQQIAESVGYVHVISFHRAFKKLFDLPPGEYRNVYRSL